MQFQHVHSSEPLWAFPGTHAKTLPSSRRFGPRVAALLHRYLGKFKPGDHPEIRGDPGKTTEIRTVDNDVGNNFWLITQNS